MDLCVDIESFWTEGYAGQIPNSGHELAIYVLFGCHIDATEQQRVLNFESVVSNWLFSVVLAAYK